MNDKLKKIIEKYGVRNQLKKFNEEVFELTEAVIEYDETCHNFKHVIEEISDVLVLLKQLQLWYEIDDKDIYDAMEYKVDRQLNRIAESEEHLII